MSQRTTRLRGPLAALLIALGVGAVLLVGEVACFSLIVMVFVGLPIVERYDSHLRVEFLEERLGPGAKKVFRIISRILILGCVAGVLAGEAQLFPQIKVLKTHAAGIPYAWLHTVMIVFSVLWGIFALLGLIRDIRKKV